MNSIVNNRKFTSIDISSKIGFVEEEFEFDLSSFIFCYGSNSSHLNLIFHVQVFLLFIQLSCTFLALV